MALAAATGALTVSPSAYAQEADDATASSTVLPDEIELDDIDVDEPEPIPSSVTRGDGDAAPIVLPDVVVRYRLQELARVGGSAHLLTEADLETFEHDDPHAVLLKVPGVYLRQEDGYGLRPNIGLRGASSDRSKKVTLMEDEVLFGPAPYSAPAAYYFPLLTRMQSIEIFKGPAAIRYGPNTIGGAVNLVTRAIPQAAGGGLDLAYGSHNYGKLHGHFGVRNKWAGILFEGVVLNSDGFKELDGGGPTGFTKGEFMLKGMVQSDPLKSVYHRADVKLGYSLETSNETYLGLTDADFRTSPHRRYAASALDRMQNDRVQLQLDYTLSLGDWLDLSLTTYRHGYYRAWRKVGGFRDGPSLSDILASPDAGERAVYYAVLTGVEDSYTDGEALMIGTNARRYLSQGIALKGRANLETGPVTHDVEAGLRLHHDRIRRHHTNEAYWMLDGRLEHAGEDTLTTADNVAASLAVAGHLIYGLSGWGLTLSPGVRFEAIHATTDDALGQTVSTHEQLVGLLGLGLHYALSTELGVLAGVHQGFSPVSPGQAQHVEPETSTNYELGVRYARAESSTLLEAVGFVSDYSNLIGECTFSTGCQAEQLDRQYNAGEVVVAGLELVAAHRFDVGAGMAVPLRLAYTFTHAAFDSDFSSENPQFGDVRVGDQLPYVPAHQVALQAGIDGPTWAANVSAAIVDEMRETAGQGAALPSEVTDLLVLVDVAARVEPLPGIVVYLKVDNLLMQNTIVSRRPYGARPGKPFSLSVGLKLRL